MLERKSLKHIQNSLHYASSKICIFIKLLNNNELQIVNNVLFVPTIHACVSIKKLLIYVFLIVSMSF